jgi:hypothetical protein
MSINTWERCPICNGEGVIADIAYATTAINAKTCPTCKGTRIISSVTGLPPAYGVQDLNKQGEPISKQYKPNQ